MGLGALILARRFGDDPAMRFNRRKLEADRKGQGER